MPEIVQLTKMSVAKLGVKKSDRGKIAVILGKATGSKEKEGPDGRIWSALSGVFQATNLLTGEIFRSALLFLPEGIHDVINNAVRALPETGGVVRFALELRRVDSDNPIGYSYQAVNMMPIETDTDELSDVLKLVESKVKQLPDASTIEKDKQAETTKKQKAGDDVHRRTLGGNA